MADTESPKHPVDSLDSTLAIVLKETGKFFHASQSNDPGQAALARTAIFQTIPAANLRFHVALDKIETDIIRAKSVFERDLSSIRTKRAERERAAAGILRSRSPNRIVKNTAPKGSPKVLASAAPSSTANEADQKPPDIAKSCITEIHVTEEPITAADSKPTPETVNAATTVQAEPFSIPQSLPPDPDEPKGLAISLDQGSSLSPPTTPTKPESETINGATDLLKQANAAPPNFSNADFESMFDDPDLPGSNDEIDFDMTFSTDNVNDPTDLLDASAFENIPMGNPDNVGTQNNNNTTASEDLTTLLPGLENYVTDSNTEFQLPDIMSGSNLLGDNNSIPILPIPNSNSNNPAIPNTGDGDGDGDGQPTQTITNAPIIESSFDDMFGIDSYMNGTGDDELGGTGSMGEVGDFDEEWFKTAGM
ncbi:MAG: hypothetical protein Q9224_005788 [Gallowayella concinna]